MAASIIDGRKMAAEIKQEVREETARLKSEKKVVPGLGFILVGEDPGSEAYVRSKGKACAELGFHSETLQLPGSTSEKEVLALIRAWNAGCAPWRPRG